MPTVPRAQGDQVSLVDSFKRLAAWLKTQDAVGLMQSLSPGAKPIQLSKLEQKLGFTVPRGLRALWLMHDGQRSADDSIIGNLHLLPVAWVLNARPATLALLKRVRADPAQLKNTGFKPEEAQSDKWLPIATRGTQSIIVSADTGRVFAGSGTEPFLRFQAASVPQWLENYVEAVERDEYELVLDDDGAFLVPRTDP
jgi:cell wall assembly regulator SMI1